MFTRAPAVHKIAHRRVTNEDRKPTALPLFKRCVCAPVTLHDLRRMCKHAGIPERGISAYILSVVLRTNYSVFWPQLLMRRLSGQTIQPSHSLLGAWGLWIGLCERHDTHSLLLTDGDSFWTPSKRLADWMNNISISGTNFVAKSSLVGASVPLLNRVGH